MDEFATLQTLRNDVEAPRTAQLAPAFDRLNQAMMRETEGLTASPTAPITPIPASSHVGSASRPPRVRRIAWSLGGVVGAITLTVAGGNVAMAVDSAQTAQLLRDIAGTTMAFEDATPRAGEYLLSSTRADWGVTVAAEGDPTTATYAPNTQQIDVYMPADSSADWVLVRDWGTQVAITAPTGSDQHIEYLTAPNGSFYAGLGSAGSTEDIEHAGWLSPDFAEIPSESGEAAYDWVDAQYTGGSNSRAEDNFERITGYLRSGLVPAPQRAALLEALALVPGVSSTANVANLDGRLGTAIGRTEAFRDGARTEIILDPTTGLVIGERALAGLNIFGFGTGDVVSNTAIDTQVVSAPPAVR